MRENHSVMVRLAERGKDARAVSLGVAGIGAMPGPGSFGSTSGSSSASDSDSVGGGGFGHSRRPAHVRGRRVAFGTDNRIQSSVGVQVQRGNPGCLSCSGFRRLRLGRKEFGENRAFRCLGAWLGGGFVLDAGGCRGRRPSGAEIAE